MDAESTRNLCKSTFTITKRILHSYLSELSNDFYVHLSVHKSGPPKVCEYFGIIFALLDACGLCLRILVLAMI
jgi:hypothetical protein